MNRKPREVIDVEVLADELHGAGGFAQLRRLTVRNRRDDGSLSPSYLLDLVERPGRADAVVVLPYQADAGGQTRVLLRRGLRPVPRLGRAGQARRSGASTGWTQIEAVAGILEPGDLGEEGLRRRAALELEEEVGLSVEDRRITIAGPSVLISAGIMAEEIFFCEVEAELQVRLEPGAGDGSCLEEGGSALVMPLDHALAWCREGEIQDAKTELALRRLAERLEAGR
jgi:ADP-ribose pyrophosphatase